MVSLDSQVVATALPVIRLHLHASLAAPVTQGLAWTWIFWLNVPSRPARPGTKQPTSPQLVQIGS